MAWPNVTSPNHHNYSRSPLHTHTCLFSFLSPIHACLNPALAVESVSSPTQQKHSFPIDVARVHSIRRLVLLPLTGGTIAGVFDGGSPHTCSGQFPPRLTRTGGCYAGCPSISCRHARVSSWRRDPFRCCSSSPWGRKEKHRTAVRRQSET